MFFEKLSKAKLIKDGDDDLPESEGAMSENSARSAGKGGAHEQFKGFNSYPEEEEKQEPKKSAVPITPGDTPGQTPGGNSGETPGAGNEFEMFGDDYRKF